MDQLISAIETLADSDTEITFSPMVDTDELSDVAVAQRARLGFIGLNGLLITPEFGSYVYLVKSLPISHLNQTIRWPINAAAVRAASITVHHRHYLRWPPNAKRCLSYQTQTKGFMPEEFRPKFAVSFTAVIFATICPFNKGKDFHFHPDMEPDPESVMPELQPVLTISNKQFKLQFGHLAGSWRGKKPLQRNAIIALANVKDRTAIPKLLDLNDTDPRPVIRGTAAWALSQLVRDVTHEILYFLETAAKREEEPEAQVDFDNALQILKERYSER